MQALSRIIYSCLIASMMAPAPALAETEAPRDIFSTPDATSQPTFKGRVQSAVFTDPLMGPNGDPPTRDAIRAIPSITGEQRKRLDQIIFGNRDAIAPMQDELTSLHRILDQRKNLNMPAVVANSLPPLAPNVLGRGEGMDGSMMDGGMMAAPPGQARVSPYNDESDEAVKARIEVLNEQINQIKNSQWPTIRAMLSPQQLRDLELMRHGQLLIVNNARTDVPEPIQAKPVPKPQGPLGILGQRGAAGPVSTPLRELKQVAPPLFNTTKQVLYRALWRL